MGIITASIFSFIITVIIMSLYFLIKPDNSNVYAFKPFPSKHPENIPSPGQRYVPNCNIEAVELPIGDDDCTKVCGKNTELTPTLILPNQTVVYHGQTLTEGKKYCVPKPPRNCSNISGTLVWSSVGGQGWNCICKYPTLYTNPDSGCNDQQVCKITGDGIIKKEITLSSSDINNWIPTDPTLTNISPYSSKDNNPDFSCDCTKGYDDNHNAYVKMPNDPYRCHKDPCFPTDVSSDTFDNLNNKEPGTAKGFVGGNEVCDCGKPYLDADGNYKDSKSRLVKSNVDKKCRTSSCNKWDGDKCVCKNSYYFRECDAKYYSRPGKPKCKAYELNTVGGECYNPCAVPGICGQGGICKVNTNDLKKYSCKCKEGLYKMVKDTQNHDVCSSCIVDAGHCEKDSDLCCGEKTCVSVAEHGSLSRRHCGNKSSGCFTSNTLVLLSDGSFSTIGKIEKGTKILGYGGSISTLKEISETLQSGFIYGFNEEPPFFTVGHPFYTPDGLKSIDPEITVIDNTFIDKPGKLQIGDIVFKAGLNKIGDVIYRPIIILKITKQEITNTSVFGLRVEGHTSYHANGYAVAAIYPIITAEYFKNGLKKLNISETKQLLSSLSDNGELLSRVLSIGFMEHIIP
jgi:hypothetical protein